MIDSYHQTVSHINSNRIVLGSGKTKPTTKVFRETTCPTVKTDNTVLVMLNEAHTESDLKGSTFS